MSKEEDIIDEISVFLEEQKGYLERLKLSFEYIKYRNITRRSEIEGLLDAVLSIIQTDDDVKLYTDICLYYHAIDKEAAKAYAKYYLEMYEDDTVIKEIEKVENNINKYKKEKINL